MSRGNWRLERSLKGGRDGNKRCCCDAAPGHKCHVQQRSSSASSPARPTQCYRGTCSGRSPPAAAPSIGTAVTELGLS